MVHDNGIKSDDWWNAEKVVEFCVPTCLAIFAGPVNKKNVSKKYRDQLSCSEKKPNNWFITGKSTGLYTHWGFIGHLGGHSLYTCT